MNTAPKKKFVLYLVCGTLCVVLFAVLLILYLLFSKGETAEKILFGILESLVGLSLTINFSFAAKISININKTKIKDNHSIKNDNHSNVLGNQTIINYNQSVNKEEINRQIQELRGEMAQFKNNNIANIKDMITKELENKTYLMPEVNFLMKFLEDGSTISEEYIQKIWAKIFVQKASEQKSVSKRLLDIVKNISIDEAKMFEKFCICVLDNAVVCKDFTSNITFGEITTLQDIGLVKASDISNWSIRFDSNHIGILCSENYTYIFIDKSKTKITLNIPSYVMTKEGVELKKSLKCSTSLETLIKNGKLLKNKYAKENVDVLLCQIEERRENEIRFNTNKDLLKF